MDSPPADQPTTANNLLDDRENDNENDADDRRATVEIKRVKRTQPKLDENRLCGENGIPKLVEIFKTYQADPKKDEYENLADVMAKMQHWGHCLYPKMRFDDFLTRVEHLGSKRQVQLCVAKLRLDLNNDNGEDDERMDEGRRLSPSKDVADDNNAVLPSTTIPYPPLHETTNIQAQQDPTTVVAHDEDDEADWFLSTMADAVGESSVTTTALSSSTQQVPPSTDAEAARARCEQNRLRAAEIRARRLAALQRQADARREDERLATYQDIW